MLVAVADRCGLTAEQTYSMCPVTVQAAAALATCILIRRTGELHDGVLLIGGHIIRQP